MLDSYKAMHLMFFVGSACIPDNPAVRTFERFAESDIAPPCRRNHVMYAICLQRHAYATESIAESCQAE